eukprot:NODE_121_length_17861_cov_0.498480.p15 type:complete len:141 gc:universal NODE_121_length_17861_cov_0.498480:16436-16858(+)
MTLVPRTTGLSFITQNIEYDAIYDFTMAFKDLSKQEYPYQKYPLLSMLTTSKYPKEVHFHCRRIPKSDIPQPIDQWLYKIFEEKDEMIQNYLKTGQLKHPTDVEYHETRYKPAFKEFPIQIAYLWCLMALFAGIYLNNKY